MPKPATPKIRMQSRLTLLMVLCAAAAISGLPGSELASADIKRMPAPELIPDPPLAPPPPVNPTFVSCMNNAHAMYHLCIQNSTEPWQFELCEEAYRIVVELCHGRIPVLPPLSPGPVPDPNA